MPPDKIFHRSYMDFEQKYKKDPGMNRVKLVSAGIIKQISFNSLQQEPVKRTDIDLTRV